MKDEVLETKINEISKNAKRLTLKGSYHESIEEYQKGLALLGDEVMKSKYAVMLFSGIGEAYFLEKKWENALEYYGFAVQSDGGLVNP